jgi:Dolichyl-phosphate-mannose-protein mannosyltransferase
VFALKHGFISPRIYWLSLGVIITGILLRFLCLDADPRYYEWVGYITDEGRWIQHARNLALHGTLVDSSRMNFHLFMAPLFELSNYLVFELFGVSLLTSRIFTAFCGSAILTLFWACLRRAVSPQALLVGVALLALESNLVALSRMAVPEMVVISFLLATYFLIVLGTHPSQILSAGLLLLVASGMKVTAALSLPIFSIMILVMPRRVTDTRRWRDLVLFLSGFLITGLIGGGIGYFLISDQIPSLLGNVAGFVTLIETFSGISKGFLYHLISFPFQHSLSYTFNLWSLGVWLGTMGWWASGWDKIDFRLHRYLTTSGTWFILYFLLMSSLEYFPTRYRIHILIPMALFITFGTSLIQKVGMVEVIRAVADAKGRFGLFWLSMFGVPTAVFFSPLLMSIIALLGIDSQRLSSKLSCFLFLLVAVTYFGQKSKRNSRVVSFLLIFPLMEAMIWLVLPMLGIQSFWPTEEFGIYAVYSFLGILVAIALSYILLKVTDMLKSTEGSQFITVVTMVCLTISLVRIIPGYFDRHYSIRDSSRDLSRLLPATATIATFKAETMFNNNNLRYSSFAWRAEKPDFLLVTFDFTKIKDFFEKEYHFIKSYNVWVSPEYGRSGSNSVGHVNEGLIVALYKKNEMGQAVGAKEIFSGAVAANGNVIIPVGPASHAR